MTREERIANIAELHAKAEKLALEYNSLMGNDKAAEARKLYLEINDIVDEHNEDSRALCFGDCRDSENPMLTAVTVLTYPTIALKEEKNKEDKAAAPTLTVITKSRNIDLRALHKFVNGGIGADKNWIHMVEQFNFRLTLRVATELGCSGEKLKEISDSYAMTALAKELELSKSPDGKKAAPDPTSNTQMVKTLQLIVTAMLGDGYKATTHDVKYIEWLYGKKGKNALTVNCANHKFLTQYICEVCHHIVTGAEYSPEYKQVKA